MPHKVVVDMWYCFEVGAESGGPWISEIRLATWGQCSVTNHGVQTAGCHSTTCKQLQLLQLVMRYCGQMCDHALWLHFGSLYGLVWFTRIVLSAYHLRNQYRHATVHIHTDCPRLFMTSSCFRFDLKHPTLHIHPRYKGPPEEWGSWQTSQEFSGLLENLKIHYRFHRDSCTVLGFFN